jgi:hypothetical protein
VNDLLLRDAGKSLEKPHWHDGQNEEGKACSPTDQTAGRVASASLPERKPTSKILRRFFEFAVFEIVLDLGRMKGEDKLYRRLSEAAGGAYVGQKDCGADSS